ncbi:MAG: hypothetical protein ACTS9Y_13425 [Methylophilus sp.]|uniref:hypothetical protein n=1 Tax=Methylophilus sp. TaxID=29541 RepID=UPI003F9F7E63
MIDENELNRLATKAQQADAAATEQAAVTEQTGTGDQGIQTIELTLDAEMAMMLNMILNMLKPALPSLEQIYTPPVIQALSESTAAVCNKHGWLQNGLAGKFAEELALGAIVIPVGLATYKGVTADIAYNKAAQTTQEKPVEPAKAE